MFVILYVRVRVSVFIYVCMYVCVCVCVCVCVWERKREKVKKKEEKWDRKSVKKEFEEFAYKCTTQTEKFDQQEWIGLNKCLGELLSQNKC